MWIGKQVTVLLFVCHWAFSRRAAHASSTTLAPSSPGTPTEENGFGEHKVFLGSEYQY